MIGNADYSLITASARTVSDAMPSDRRPARAEPLDQHADWEFEGKKIGAGLQRLFEGSQRGDWRRVDREWLTRSTICPGRWGRYRPSPSGRERRPVQPGSVRTRKTCRQRPR